MSENERGEKPQGVFQSKPFRMVLALLTIIVAATAALEGAHLMTQDIIAANQVIKLQSRVLDVLHIELGGRDLDSVFSERVAVKSFPQPDGRAFDVWLGRGADGGLSGYAVRLRGGGFQGIIDVVVGLTPDLALTTGFEVVESGETPGLGDEMRTCKDFERDTPEKCFKKWFYQGIATEPRVDFVKYKLPDKPNQFRAITGASYTSTAINNFLNAALAKLRALKDSGELELES